MIYCLLFWQGNSKIQFYSNERQYYYVLKGPCSSLKVNLNGIYLTMISAQNLQFS